MHDFINWINHSLFIWCPFSVVCCVIKDKEINRKRSCSQTIISEVDFLYYFIAPLYPLYSWCLYLCKGLLIGLSYHKYYCHLSPTATLPEEWKSLQRVFRGMFCLRKDYNLCFQSSKHIPSLHTCTPKWPVPAKRILLSKIEFRAMTFFSNSFSHKTF